MRIILIPVLALATAWLGYGPFSRKRNSTVGGGFILFGFLLRMASAVLLMWTIAILVFVISMAT